MSTTLLDRPTAPVLSTGSGGVPARLAMFRWARRLFVREWRQQILILALIIVAVAATIIGATVARNTPPPANTGFGTAQDMVSLQTPDTHLTSQLATLQQQFRTLDIIENQTITIPGSISTYNLRAQNPRGAFGQPMLQLLSGHFPSSANQVAVTGVLASTFHLRIGSIWNQNGTERHVVGIVQNPQSLLDEFALVPPGQVHSPTQVSVLFDAHGFPPRAAKGFQIETPNSLASSNALNPQTISIAVLVLGMLLIALVSIGGFTVMAQRRMRSLGMLQSLGATDRNVGMVVRANGLVVGVAGAVIGGIVGMAGWLIYRPSLESSAHHEIGVFALPWAVIALALILAVVSTYFAASRPAKSIRNIPVVTALAGRPAPPKQIHRSALPGIVCLGVAFLALAYAGGGSGFQPRTPELLLGLVLLIPGIILLSPFALSALARLGRRAPIATRIALRDLARYRARSGSALAAISLGVMVAMIIVLVASARYGNVLDYAGPNVASNQVVLYANAPPPAGAIIVGPNGQRHRAPTTTSPTVSATVTAQDAKKIATALGATQFVPLESASGNLQHSGTGRNWSGQIYVGTPQLLGAFGIAPSQVTSEADFISARPGLPGTAGLQFTFNGSGKQGPGPSNSSGCSAANGCINNPPIQENGALPAGTSAPNTVFTEYAVSKYHLHTSLAGWFIQTAAPPTAAQISNARIAAASANLSLETKNSAPSSNEITTWATLFGIALALGILGMSVGLIRSETAGDLRTLAAAGASSSTRRWLTAVTAGGLGLLGGILGTLAAYVGVLGFLANNQNNGGIGSLGNVPIKDILVILIAMPLFAALIGWVLGGR
ncbi:MAG TPA: FtsX-like permease family protein, partial [Acidimicrobiales bacterium]